MKPRLIGALVVACAGVAGAGSALAQDADAPVDFSGKLRLQWDNRTTSTVGPVAQANALQSDTVPYSTGGWTQAAELHASARHWNFSGTAQQQEWAGQGSQGSAWINELVATADAGNWKYSAGKKIVAWDIGYAFRPNDMVQQADRRALVDVLDQGRPLLMAEYFDAETSWSLVAVNPGATADQTGADEPALAARYYQRQGAVDWHGFTRVADRTGFSAGAAASWVASDALELHASARYLQRADCFSMTPTTAPLLSANPWQASLVSNAMQALVGGSWTSASNWSVLVEAWWDGTALSQDQWAAWRNRNQDLPVLASQGYPASAVAGNLAWQAQALDSSSSLERSNLYARLSWDLDAWQPALDVAWCSPPRCCGRATGCRSRAACALTLGR